MEGGPVSLPFTVSDKQLEAAAAHSLPRLGATAHALLLCARETLDQDQIESLKTLCRSIENWCDFVQQAEFRLVTPLVYKHFSSHAEDVVPGDVLAELKAATLRGTCRNLSMIAAHHRLVKEVLEPAGTPYLFFKGASLAYRFYQNPANRQFRDIDVLIPAQHMVEVGQKLREAGYRAAKREFAASDHGLHFLKRFVGMMDWYSPEGVLIEMPSSLDSEWGRLPTEEAIAGAVSVDVAGVNVPAPADADFFGYMCKHHGRHHWARLNWIADLNVILSSPVFDLQAALDRAKERGFSRLVGAALEIHRAVASPTPWSYRFSDPFAHELFRHCLINLEGDFEQELALRDSFPTTSIDISRQRRKWHFHIKRNLKRFKPDGEDFVTLPLSPRLQWLYYLIRPFLYMKRQLN